MHQAGPADVPEQLQARLLDMLDDGVVGTDADFRITHWNPGAERLYGHTAAEVLGVPANQSRRSPATTSASTSSASSSSTARSRVEITAVRGDGTPVEVEIVVSAMHDAAGMVRGYLGIHRDITERRRAARRLEQLSAVVGNSRDFIGFADLDGRVVFVNDAGLRLLGLRDRAEAEDHDVIDFVAEH